MKSKPKISLFSLRRIPDNIARKKLHFNFPVELHEAASAVAKRWNVSITLYFMYCIIWRLVRDAGLDNKWLYNIRAIIKKNYPAALERKARRKKATEVEKKPTGDFLDFI